MRKESLKIGSQFVLSLLLTALALPAWGAAKELPKHLRPQRIEHSQRRTVPTTTGVPFPKKVSRVATVAQSGGDYTNPVTAMSNLATWCGTPSDTNPCLLRIMPGVYDLAGGSLNMRPYVDIEGSGEASTTISSATNASGVVNGASSAEIRFLSVHNTASSGTVMAIANGQDQSPTITHVTATAGGHGDNNYGVFSIQSVPTLNYVTAIAAGAATNFAIYLGDAASSMNNITATAWGGSYSIGVWVGASNTTMNNVIATASGATSNYGVLNIDSSMFISNATATAWGGLDSYGVFNATASLTMSNVTATAIGTGYNNGYGLYNTEAPSVAHADRSTFEGNTNSVFNDVLDVYIGASKLVGPALNNGQGTLTCANSYNGNYVPLGANCQ